MYYDQRPQNIRQLREQWEQWEQRIGIRAIVLPDYQWSGYLRRQMDAVDYPRPDAGQAALSGFDIFTGKYRLKHTCRPAEEIAARRFNQPASLPAEPLALRVRPDPEGKGLEAGAGSHHWMGQKTLSRYHSICAVCFVKHRQKIVKLATVPGFGNHLVFYIEHSGHVDVLRVLHSARDVPRHFLTIDSFFELLRIPGLRSNPAC